MDITVNGTLCKVPFHLSNITVGQFIDYYERYGNKLQQQFREIETRDYKQVLINQEYKIINQEAMDLLKQIDIDNYIDNEALSWFSYWTGFDFFEVKDEPFIPPVLAQYRVLKSLLEDSAELIKAFEQDVEWNGENWCISDFKQSTYEAMTYNERKINRDVLLSAHDFKRGRMTSLPYLCTVYFRKKDEPFTQDLLSNGRMELMKELPMHYAMSIGLLLKEALDGAIKNEFSTN